jgi:hypothetical protein
MSDYEPGYDDEVVYEDVPPQSSIAAPLIRALLAAAVAFGIYALVFGGSGDGDLDLADTGPTEAPVVIATPTQSSIPLEPMPSGTASPAPGGGTETPTEGTTEGPGAGGEIGAGISVQVIAGATTTGDQVDDAVQALVELGYDVTESGISPTTYPQTTVFATPGEEAHAEALVAADSRFTTFDPEFPGLNESIQLHVLVGEDWPT